MIKPPQSWQNTRTYLKDILTSDWYKAIAQITATLISSTHDFYKKEGIKPFIFPVTTGSISSPMGKGSDSVPITIQIKGNTIYLADSMQFSLELATRLNERGAYYIMPTFRGEDNDDRHLNEFVHSEVEVSGTFDDIVDLAEKYIKYICEEVNSECKEIISKTAGTTEHLEGLLSAKNSFTKVPYSEALNILKNNENAFQKVGTDYPSITSQGEKELIKKFGDFTWLTELPYSNVPFYQARIEDSQFAQAADLLAGIGEILGCGQRVHTKKDLEKSLEFHKVSFHGYEWYSEMREIQTLQTSGFGMGLERLILWLTKTDDIRNCCILYRDHRIITFP